MASRPPSETDLQGLLRSIRERVQLLRHKKDLHPLMDRLSRARVVMLGEASHGTQEFYEWRRLISEWLIVKHGFNLIAVEGEWPSCWELNRFIHGKGEAQSAREVLSHFDQWPTWMWANTEIVRLAEWLRSHNSVVSQSQQVGFYGLDIYSLFESIEMVLKELEKINPFLARRARIRYECFDPFQGDGKAYARSLTRFPDGCEKEAFENLKDVLRLRLDGLSERDELLFDAQQNARVVARAENFYRTMMHGDGESWNVRDRHMLDTLEVLLQRHGENSKAIVWAHNTHIGDYRATDMSQEGLVNLGGLAREKWGEEKVALVGFGTFEGKVTASHSWGGPIEKMNVPAARPGSCEAVFHQVAESAHANSLFILMDDEARQGPLAEVLGHRAIGVVYDPAHERLGNYVPTQMAQRYDAFVFVDFSTGVEPLVLSVGDKELPETWPMGQ